MDVASGEPIVVDFKTKILSFDFLAQFALNEQNKKNSSALQFVKGLQAMEQFVSGMMYYIVFEAKDGSEKINVYEARVWYELDRSLELVKFEQLPDSASST